MSDLSLTSRRGFLTGTIAGGLGASLAANPAADAVAADPPRRNGRPYMKLSLAGYSFSRLLPRRWTPEQLKSAKMTLDDFITFSAEQDLDGVEPTAYYFPKTVTNEYLVHLKQLTFRLGLDISGTAIGNDFCLPKGQLRTVVCPSRMAPFGLKLWENAFQRIPDISFFHAHCALFDEKSRVS